MMDDLRSLRQHVKATRVSYRVATLRLVREAIVARGDGYQRPHEEVALLDVDVRAALALYAAEDALPTRTQRAIPRVPSLGRGAFRRDYMYANEPVVVEDVVDGTWGFAAFAGADGGVDVAALAERFGDMPVPVRRGETRGELPFRDFAAAFREGGAYLKDWHFRLDGLGAMAPVPDLFDDDWLSGEGDVDFHFCYLGAAGTSTRLHCDVINSFSWSVNVFGWKRWRFLPAEETPLLWDAFGGDVADAFGPSTADFPRRGRAMPVEVLQPPRSAIFVPSGWYHDVENVTDALSVNCNWVNGANCLWAPARLDDDDAADASNGDLSRDRFLAKVARAAKALIAADLDEDGAAALARAGAVARLLEDTQGDPAVAIYEAADAALREAGAPTSRAVHAACLELAADPDADVTLEDSESESDDGFLGRVAGDLFEDDGDAKPRRQPLRRGWTPGFREQVDLGVRSFDFTLENGEAVSCAIEYRDAGTGSSVWDGAVVLARYLETHPAKVAGRRVVELGSGTGFGGLVAARLGASEVLLTDLDQCLPLIEANVRRNGLADRVAAAPLRWGEPADVSADVVLVADCLLPGCDVLFEPLCRTLAALLARGAAGYFVYEQRCMDCRPFFALLDAAGVDAAPVPDGDLHATYRAPEIHVLELRSKFCS